MTVHFEHSEAFGLVFNDLRMLSAYCAGHNDDDEERFEFRTVINDPPPPAEDIHYSNRLDNKTLSIQAFMFIPMDAFFLREIANILVEEKIRHRTAAKGTPFII
jgi:hypothetical protein